MIISAYQAAMLRLGRNVDQFEVVENGQEFQDGDHYFRNVIFRDFFNNTFLLEVITNENWELARPWSLENECPEVRLVKTEDGLEYIEIEEEEPLQ